MENIPAYVKENILPTDSLNVLNIISFPCPPFTNPPQLLLSVANLFSKNSSIVQDATAARVLLSLCIPDINDLSILKTKFLEAERDGFQSFIYPVNNSVSGVKLPFWVVDFWQAIHKVISSKAVWSTAIQWIRSKGELRALALLEEIPWNSTLGPRMAHQSIEPIATLCSEKWLSSTHMDLFSAVLEDELQLAENITASVMDTSFLELIIMTYRFWQKTYPDAKSLSHIRMIGDKLRDGTCTTVVMSMSVHITEGGTFLPTNSNRGNHWTTLFIDAEKSSILYGDSLKLPPPAELANVLEWWLDYHHIKNFRWGDLPSTTQSDNFSCSIFSANSMSHSLLPTTFPLVPEDRAISARIDMLKRIITFLKRTHSVSCTLSVMKS
jgi:hypothetical protein